MRNRMMVRSGPGVWMLVVFLFFHSEVAALQMASSDKHSWHQWRGPLASGVAPHARPPLTWDENTNVKWKVPIQGEGISTPVVWNDRVYLVSAIETDRVPDSPPVKDDRAMTRPPGSIFQFTVTCLDLASGDVIWSDVCTEQAPHEGRHHSSSYAAASPMTDGKRLIVSFGSTGIFCYSLEGEKQWAMDPDDMHTRRGWGEATSPVLVDDRVIVVRDNEDESSMLALDAATGETCWEIDRDEPTTWATPLIIERDGAKHVVTNGTQGIRANDLQTGRQIWKTSGTTLNAIPSPVEFGDSVICMAGYRGNRAVSIRIGSAGEIRENWELRRGTPYVPSPLLSGNRLYFTQSNQAILYCVNAETGEYFFGPQRLKGLENLYGSPIAADGRVYLTSREGVTAVFPDSTEYELLATNQLDDHFDASPVAVGSSLLLRGKQYLYCLEEK